MRSWPHTWATVPHGTSFFSKDGIREYFAGLKDYAGLTGTLSCGADGNDAGDCGSKEVSIAQLVRWRLHRGLHDPVGSSHLTT